MELPREIQVDVTKRIANMDRTSPEIIKDVEVVLERKLSSTDTSDFTEIGGIKYIAEILNSVDTSTEKYIMEEMNNNDPVLTEEIRKHMFVFDDIAKLDSVSIQRFLQDVNPKDLLVALKSSSEEVTNAFYSNMSSRMRETLSEDAKYIRGVRMSDVEDAQQKLITLARKLEESGEIFISRGRKDEILV
jgi:flagellar motor switch protein FliG